MIAADDCGAVERGAGADVLRRAVVLAWLLARARHELLAVEHRGAAARAGGARGIALGRARHALRRGRPAGDRRRRPRGRAAQPALRAEGLGRVDEQRHQRAHEPDLRRSSNCSPNGRSRATARARSKRSTSATRRPSAENATSASHTIPVTVAAEQGIVGLALYAALLVIVALLVLLPRRRALAAADRDRGLLRRAGAAHLDLRRLPGGSRSPGRCSASVSRCARIAAPRAEPRPSAPADGVAPLVASEPCSAI